MAAVDLGKLSKVAVGHTKAGRGKGWFCAQVTVRTGPDAETETIFPCGHWLDTGCEDRATHRELMSLGEMPVGGEEDDEDEAPPSRK